MCRQTSFGPPPRYAAFIPLLKCATFDHYTFERLFSQSKQINSNATSHEPPIWIIEQFIYSLDRDRIRLFNLNFRSRETPKAVSLDI